MKQYRVLGATLAALACAVSLSAAANGDIPLYQSTTITQPGRYILTRDVSSQGDVFLITTDGVTLDLNGHTVKSVAGAGVTISVTGIVMPVLIRVFDGTIRGGAYGVNVVVAPSSSRRSESSLRCSIA